jgi:hypothetical protein
VIVPFLACGDLSAFDSDMTYPSEGQSLDPVQSPINPPYKKVSHPVRGGSSSLHSWQIQIVAYSTHKPALPHVHFA